MTTEPGPHIIPSEYEWFSEQIAGHHPSVVKNGVREIGFLKEEGSDCILKLKQEGRRGDCEDKALTSRIIRLPEVSVLEAARALRNARHIRTMHLIRFYQLLNRVFLDDYSPADDVNEPFPGNSCQSNDDINTVRFIADGGVPVFRGFKYVPIDDEEHFLILEDMTHKYSRPAIMDVKVGRVTFDPEASDKKMKSETEKYPPQKILGYRLLGYRMHTEDNVVVKDKNWGKSKDETNIGQAFWEFFSARPEAVKFILRKASLFRDWFAKQTMFHFYSSSLLIVYETDPSKPLESDIRMIDFGHVFPGNGAIDDNYLFGLDNLISILEEMILKLPEEQRAEA